MLRPFGLAAALVLLWATLDLHSANAATATLDLDGGVPRTARALRAAIGKHELDGRVWLGKLSGVGGGRDTLIYVPRELRTSERIELVVYMEGHGSFADDAMDHRHAASIARLRGNFIYVAPDAPSSAHGERKARTAYWQRGCAERTCAGGHSAPGDFIVFLDQVRGRVAAMTGADASKLALRLSLVGFSNGGKGTVNALGQLAEAKFTVGGQRVELADVVFADGNYGATALDDAWGVLSPRPEARLTILLGTGDGNRKRAAAFSKKTAPNGRIRVIPLHD